MKHRHLIEILVFIGTVLSLAIALSFFITSFWASVVGVITLPLIGVASFKLFDYLERRRDTMDDKPD